MNNKGSRLWRRQMGTGKCQYGELAQIPCSASACTTKSMGALWEIWEYESKSRGCTWCLGCTQHRLAELLKLLIPNSKGFVGLSLMLLAPGAYPCSWLKPIGPRTSQTPQLTFLFHFLSVSLFCLSPILAFSLAIAFALLLSSSSLPFPLPRSLHFVNCCCSAEVQSSVTC